jgi:hypothetical protein
MEWSDLGFILRLAALALSLAFLAMGVVRYFRDSMSDHCKRLVQRSFVTYALHPVAFAFGLFCMKCLNFKQRC